MAGIFLILTSVSVIILLMSCYWLKINEFNELMFPQIKKISTYTSVGLAVVTVVVYLVSNIKIHIELQEIKDNFISAYSDYSKYTSHHPELENDVSEQIEALLNGTRTYGRYRAAALKMDSQLRLELNKIRNKDKATLESLFGTSDIEVNNVYVRNELDSLQDKQLKYEYDTGGYEFELYYTDTALRAEKEEQLREQIDSRHSDMSEGERQQLLNSYMEQFDTDRKFDISKKFKFTTSEDGTLIIGDDAKEFIRKK